MNKLFRHFTSLHYLFPMHFEELPAPSIWLRDFMPLQRADSQLVGFNYGCRYMHDLEEEIFDPKEVWDQLGLNVWRVPVTADGGHFIEASRHWLVSSAVMGENLDLSASQLTRWLSRALGKPILWIPPVPYDFTGHLDAYVRWAQGDNLLVYSKMPSIQAWQEKVNRLLRKNGYTLTEVNGYMTNNLISAEGLCLNYASDNYTIYVGGDSDKFQGLEESMKTCFPKSDVVYVDCDAVLKDGGGLHCVTWEYSTCLTPRVI